MKIIILLIGLSLFSNNSFSQEKSVKTKLDNSIRDWSIYKDEADFTVFYKFVDCDPQIGFNQESIVLKIQNKTAVKQELNWHILLEYNGVCKTCDFEEEYTYSLVLDPMQSVEGSCAMDSDSRLTIFSKFIDSGYKGNALLTGFDMKNLKNKIVQ